MRFLPLLVSQLDTTSRVFRYIFFGPFLGKHPWRLMEVVAISCVMALSFRGREEQKNENKVLFWPVFSCFPDRV